MLGRKCSDLLPEVFVRQTGMLALHIRLGGCGGSTASASASAAARTTGLIPLFLSLRLCFFLTLVCLFFLLTLFNSLSALSHFSLRLKCDLYHALQPTSRLTTAVEHGVVFFLNSSALCSFKWLKGGKRLRCAALRCSLCFHCSLPGLRLLGHFGRRARTWIFRLVCQPGSQGRSALRCMHSCVCVCVCLNGLVNNAQCFDDSRPQWRFEY